MDRPPLRAPWQPVLAGAAPVGLHDAAAASRRAGRALDLGLGITNVAPRATARADELSAAEVVDGGGVLREKVLSLAPRWLAVVGVTAYRTAFGAPKARVGPQEAAIGATRVWVLPNPSGLNAHYTADTLAEEFARFEDNGAPPLRR